MIKVSVIKKHYQVKVGAKNIVTSCDPATVTATNSDSTVVGQTTAPSGGTGNIPIADSSIKRSNGTEITSVPATEPATIQDSVVQINQVDGTPVSTNNVMAATNVTLLVPNPPTLQQVIDNNTPSDITDAIETAGYACAVFSDLSVSYGKPLYSQPFGNTLAKPLNVAVNNLADEIYVCAGNIIQVYLGDKTLDRTITGFNAPSTIRFSDDYAQYLAVQGGVTIGSQVRIMNTATDTQVALLTTTNIRAATFNNVNGNIFWSNTSHQILQRTQANSAVGSAFTSTNVPRIYTMRAQPNTSRVFVAGDSGAFNIGRVSFFDNNTLAFTNITLGTGSLDINYINGIAFLNDRIFLFHFSGALSYQAITEIDINGNVVWQALALSTDVTANVTGDIYTGCPCPVVVYPFASLNKIFCAIL